MTYLYQQKSDTVPAPIRQLPQPPVASIVSSGEILRGQQELHIHHGDSIYTLRITRQGKMILTK